MPPPRRKAPKDPRLKVIGDHVRALREQRELSQETFADKVGLDRTYISGIERGVRNFGVIVLFDLARALKVTPQDLLP